MGFVTCFSFLNYQLPALLHNVKYINIILHLLRVPGIFLAVNQAASFLDFICPVIVCLALGERFREQQVTLMAAATPAKNGSKQPLIPDMRENTSCYNFRLFNGKIEF